MSFGLFFNPLIMLGVYTFFFSVVFKARWGVRTNETQADFAIILFAGLILHALLAECVNKAPTLIKGNVNFVKKVVFPVETLAWVALCSALFHAAASFSILVTAQLVLGGGLPWTVVLFPLILMPLSLMIVGFIWFLASTGVYFKDIAHVTGLVTSMLLFVSPVFYSISTLPKQLQTLVLLNPLSLAVEQTRKVLIFGEIPDWGPMGLYTLVSVLIAWLGFFCFQQARTGFADVL